MQMLQQALTWQPPNGRRKAATDVDDSFRFDSFETKRLLANCGNTPLVHSVRSTIPKWRITEIAAPMCLIDFENKCGCTVELH
jgi:hypothetical protein